MRHCADNATERKSEARYLVRETDGARRVGKPLTGAAQMLTRDCEVIEKSYTGSRVAQTVAFVLIVDDIQMICIRLLRARVDQIVFDRVVRELGIVLHAHLFQQTRAIDAYRLHADFQFLADRGERSA